MHRKRTINVVVLTAALAIAAPTLAPSVAADGSQVSMPFSFTLTGCSMLPPGTVIDGTGDSFAVLNSRVDKNGVTHLEINNTVNGTATDGSGGTFVFNYHNHASVDMQAGWFPQTADVTDHFNLVGNGNANQLNVHFVLRATFYSPTIFTVDFINTHGDPFTCDPI